MDDLLSTEHLDKSTYIEQVVEHLERDLSESERKIVKENYRAGFSVHETTTQLI